MAWGRLATLAFASTLVSACGRIDFDPLDPLDGAAESPCSPSAILCDDFESGDASKWYVRVNPTTNMLTIDSTEVHGGAFAVDAVSTMQTGFGSIAWVCKDIPVQTTGMLAIRAWLNTPVQLDGFRSVIGTHNNGTCATPSPPQYTSVACSAGNWVVVEGSPTAGLVNHFGTACMASATWTCVELDYTLDAPARVQLYMNDSLVVDAAIVDAAPAIGQIGAGVAVSDIPGFRAFADDIVIARQHIGCF